MTVGLCFLHSFGQRLHRKEVFVKYKKGAVREKERGLHVSLMRRKFDEQVRTILTGHCSSPPVGQFPQAHVTNVKWSTLISLVAAKNGRSCWHSPTCRSASICPPPWSPTLTTTLLTSNPSGRFSSDSSARAASKLGFSRFRRKIIWLTDFFSCCLTLEFLCRKPYSHYNNFLDEVYNYETDLEENRISLAHQIFSKYLTKPQGESSNTKVKIQKKYRSLQAQGRLARKSVIFCTDRENTRFSADWSKACIQRRELWGIILQNISQRFFLEKMREGVVSGGVFCGIRVEASGGFGGEWPQHWQLEDNLPQTPMPELLTLDRGHTILISRCLRIWLFCFDCKIQPLYADCECNRVIRMQPRTSQPSQSVKRNKQTIAPLIIACHKKRHHFEDTPIVWQSITSRSLEVQPLDFSKSVKALLCFQLSPMRLCNLAV